MNVNAPSKDRAPRRARARLVVPSALAAALALSAGCRRDEVTHFRVPKESAAPVGVGAGAMPASMPGAPGMEGDLPPPPSSAGGLRWTLPKGWTETMTGGMRYATLKPSVRGRIDVSVVVLPGPAGGELANVNRWRGQIGLAPMQEGEMAGARQLLQTKAGPVSVYDFTSGGEQQSRLVAGLLLADGYTWFVKMTGDAAAVGAARKDFLHLLETLRLEARDR